MLSAATNAVTGVCSSEEMEEWLICNESALLSHLYTYVGKKLEPKLLATGTVLFLFLQLSVMLTMLHQRRLRMGWRSEDVNLAFLDDCLRFWIKRLGLIMHNRWCALHPDLFVQAHEASFKLSLEIGDMCSEA